MKRRPLIALLLCGPAGFFAAEAASALLHPEAHAKASQRTLTFAERAWYQRAIEEVYWRHRIWPKDNARPKPSLGAVMSEAQLEKKVTTYLRKYQALEDQRGSPIGPSELQAEMDRIARHTKRPEMLRELFEALKSDPFVIAECLARPTLAERVSGDLTIAAGASPAVGKPSAADTAASIEKHIRATNIDAVMYKLPKISVSTGCTDDTWAATSTVSAPDARFAHTALWTGSEMIVWGGYGTDYLNSGARYDPATDNWASTSSTNAPPARSVHSAVWTGSEMIIWGGYDGTNELNTGGRYNPVMDSWIDTSTVNAPLGRDHHTAVWSGSEMIVWGGYGCGANCILNSGGRYDPDIDSWVATSIVNAPSPRWYHQTMWTGSEMIIWGGTDGTNYLHTGGRYNPSADSWTATGTENVPLGRIGHTALWTGGEMIIWGGVDETFNDTNTGGRYDPTADSWTATSLVNAPSPRDSHAAVWTGSEMIIWGGAFCCPGIDFDTGGRYTAGTDIWTTTSTSDAPHARDSHTAVWTGSEMIVWGGGYFVGSNFIPLNTGGRYCAQSEATPTPTPTATPTATSTPSATPTPRIAPTPRSRPTPRPRP